MDIRKSIALAAALAALAGCAADDPAPPDTTPPSVRIVSPEPGAVLLSPARMTAAATDESGVRSVTFFVDADSVGRDDAPPYECDWDPSFWADGGTHTLQATASDGAGNVGRSHSIGITVSASATAVPALVSPAEGSVLDGPEAVLSWSPVGGAAWYILEISALPDFSAIETALKTRDTTANVSFQSIGPKYWRVRAENAAGRGGAWASRGLYSGVFVKAFGGLGEDRAYAVAQTSDGGYAFAGTTDSFGAGRLDMYLVKADRSGRPEWSTTFGGAGHDGAYAMAATADGGFILGGYTGSFGVTSYEFYLVKTDPHGNEEWSRRFGGSESDALYAVRQTADGGYFIVGESYTYGPATTLVRLMKTDALGNIPVWQSSFGGHIGDRGMSCDATADGGFIVTGTTSESGTLAMYLLKLSGTGVQEWVTMFPAESGCEGFSVQQSSDGGYVLAGRAAVGSLGYCDAYVVKTNATGSELWARSLGERDWNWPGCIREVSGGGYVVTGLTESAGGVDPDMLLAKLDAAGNSPWSKSLGGVSGDWGNAFRETRDGGLVIAGVTRSFGAGGADILLVKSDARGRSVPFPAAGMKSSPSSRTRLAAPVRGVPREPAARQPDRE